MSNDLLGGLGNLGGLMKGLSGFMPQDNPDVKIFNAQQELADLQKKEDEIFAEIGRQAYATNPAGYPQAENLKLVQSNIALANQKLGTMKEEKVASEAAKESEEAKRRCSNCNTLNPEGVKFCQECGTALGAPAKCFCTSCGADLAPGIAFCGECGAKQG